MGPAGGLGEGHVDHHEAVQRVEGLAHPHGVGQRVGGVGALDDHGPKAPGVVGENLVGDGRRGDEPRDDALSRDGRATVASAAAAAAQAREAGVDVHAAALGEVAGEEVDQLLQVRAEGAVGRLLDAEVFEDGHARGAGDASGHGAHVLFGHAGDGAEGGHVDGAEVCGHVVEAVGVRGDPGLVGEVFLHDHGDEGCEAPRVGAGVDLEVMVGQGGGLGAARVDHDEAAGGVGGELLQDHPGPRKPVAVPWILADEDGHLGVLEVARGVAPGSSEELPVHPEFPGLLLGQGVGGVDRSDGRAGGRAVAPAEVVGLSSAAVIEDGGAAVGVADGPEARGNFGDGRVPVDGLVGAIGATAQGGVEAVGATLVVVEAQGLLAGVPLGGRVFAVAANLDEAAVVGAHLDAAVDAAQDAGGRAPGRVGFGRCGGRGHAVEGGSELAAVEVAGGRAVAGLVGWVVECRGVAQRLSFGRAALVRIRRLSSPTRRTHPVSCRGVASGGQPCGETVMSAEVAPPSAPRRVDVTPYYRASG